MTMEIPSHAASDGKRPLWNDALKHPLVLLLVSFLLTTIAGAFLSTWISDQIKTRELARSETENRKSAVQAFAHLIYERRTRAAMLRSSIRRLAPMDEVKDRKRSYDEAYVKWNASLVANMLLAREVLGSQYSFIETSIEVLLVKGIFAPMDRCLTAAYDALLAGQSGVAVIDTCQVDELLQRSLDCGYSIPNVLYQLSIKATDQKTASEIVDGKCSKETSPPAGQVP